MILNLSAEEKRLIAAFGENGVVYRGDCFAVYFFDKWWKVPFGLVSECGIRAMKQRFREMLKEADNA